jgi:hypothetical protein
VLKFFDGFDGSDSVFPTCVWRISGDSWVRVRYSLSIAFSESLSLSP